MTEQPDRQPQQPEPVAPPAPAGVSRAVLITGCSSGIGRATARHLAGRGWRVYATARALPDLAGLREAGCRLLALDVTDEESMRRAVAAVEAEAGAVGVLVNNAGYSQSGAFETVPLDRVRRQFETNVFGLVRLTQLVLPGMRRQRWGKVVNLSSMGGRLTFPGGAYYHATKHAVEALTDALRFEVAGFGIDAILIEPGLIRSGFGAAAAGSMAGTGGPAGEQTGKQDDPYRAFNAAVATVTQDSYRRGLLARLGAGPEAVAATIERAISARRPRARYRTDAAGRFLLAQRALLPDALWDRFLGLTFPRPG